MSSTQANNSRSYGKGEEPARRGRTMLALGAALLICSLLLFLYALINFPKTKESYGSLNKKPPAPPVRQSPEPGPTAAPPASDSQRPGLAPTISRRHASKPRPPLSPAGTGSGRLQSTERTTAMAHSGAGGFKREDSKEAAPLRLQQPPAYVSASVTPETYATPFAQPAPSQQATPRAVQSQPQKDKPNIFRRLINWLRGLFKSGREKQFVPNQPPMVSIALSSNIILRPCSQNAGSPGGASDSNQLVRLMANATDPDGDTLFYSYNVSGGRITGEGENVTWDLRGVEPGAYTAGVKVDDRQGRPAQASASVTVKCAAVEANLPCPYSVNVSAPSSVNEGDTIVFASDVSYSGSSALNYMWTVSPPSARIIGGAGMPMIVVDTTGLGKQNVTAVLVVDDGSGEPACRQTAQVVTSVSGNVLALLGGAIEGRLIAGSEPARDVTVLAVDGQGAVRGRAVTNDQGHFSIDNLPPGTYSLVAEGAQGRIVLARDVALMGSLSIGEIRLPGGGSANAATDATPRPSASPTPSPSPGASPTSTPALTTTSTVQVIKQDRIRVTYPDRFLKGDAGKVTFELKEVIGEVISQTTNTNTTVQVTATPGPIAGAQPGTVRPQINPDDYLIYVTVGLTANGLEVASAPANSERLYSESKSELWEWSLRPPDNVAEGTDASLQFRVDVRWQPKTSGADSVNNHDVWQNGFATSVGPPASRVKAAAYGSPVLAAFGLVTVGAGFKKRKDLVGAATEEAETETEDEVSGTVYAPGEAAPGDGFLVQVFIHLPEQAASLEEIAREADYDARRRITSQLQKKIKRGAELTFHLLMPGLEVDEPEQSCRWAGEPAFVQFGVTVPEDCKPKTIFGTVRVSENSVPIGHLKFKFRITGAASAEAGDSQREPAPVANMTRYRQAFISYTSKDRSEVLKRVQMLNLAKIKFFQDLLTLEPGDQWEKLLYEYIDKSDVFFLFWSTAASESDWVRKEVEYAIRRKAGQEDAAPEIIPVIIEGPPAAKPPKELSDIQFNDKLIYFINTVETTQRPPGQT